MKKYIPEPIDTSDIVLSEDLQNLCEKLAENTHEVWAKGRIDDGWTYGTSRNDEKKQTPCLVPYSDLSESEKAYDRNTVIQALKLIQKFGYVITKQ